MRRKLLRRAKRQKNELSLNDLRDIEIRASKAYHELKMAWNFDYVIPNHDGEDSDNWNTFYYPLGDARKTMLAVANLIEGRSVDNLEVWESGLIP
jgi:guanylate kinase